MRRTTFPALCRAVLVALLLSGPASAAGERKSSEAAGTLPNASDSAQVDVYKLKIDREVSLDDAAESMRLRANALNLQLVAELPLSKQVEAVTGKPQRMITIFQFCDAVTAKDLIDANPDFSVFMPCRIALIEDKDGMGWLVMMDVNVDAIAQEMRVSDTLKNRIQEVRRALLEIMQAGAKGEL